KRISLDKFRFLELLGLIIPVGKRPVLRILNDTIKSHEKGRRHATVCCPRRLVLKFAISHPCSLLPDYKVLGLFSLKRFHTIRFSALTTFISFPFTWQGHHLENFLLRAPRK